MPGDPGQRALDGRANGDVHLEGVVIRDGQELPWRPCELYRKVTDSQDRDARRGRGALGAAGKGGPKPGQPWRTTSTLDEATVLAEELTKVYVDPAGAEWTLHDMVLELFQDLQERRKAAGQ